MVNSKYWFLFCFEFALHNIFLTREQCRESWTVFPIQLWPAYKRLSATLCLPFLLTRYSKLVRLLRLVFATSNFDVKNTEVFNHRLFTSRLETDSDVLFSSRFICSKICRYVRSARLFSRFTRFANKSNKTVKYAWPLKTFPTSAFFFLQRFFSFSTRF